MKMVEEVSPEICEILEKLDKPASLLELGLERVHGLGFIQEGASMEQLPVTLKVQVEHWSTTRDSKIREKMGFLVQAVDRIEKMISRVKFSIIDLTYYTFYNFSAASEELSLQPNLVCNDRDLKNLLGERTSPHRNILRR